MQRRLQDGRALRQLAYSRRRQSLGQEPWRPAGPLLSSVGREPVGGTVVKVTSNGDTYARLAAGFGVGTTTVWRYIREAVDLLAATAPDLATAMRRIRRLAFALLDGTLIPIDRLRGPKNRPHHSGKHQHHGVNLQVIADPAGRLVWASPALPGATYDLTAAREHGIIAALTDANVYTLADKAHRGASPTVRVPFYGRDLPPRMRDCNSSRNKTSGPGERANATLKIWKLLAKLRCCPQRATAITAAILLLPHIEVQR